MIDNVALFISQNEQRGTIVSTVPSTIVKQHGGLKAVKATLLKSTEWYAHLGNMPIFDGKPSFTVMRKLHEDWAAAGSPIVVGELHPCYQMPELMQVYHAIRYRITSSLVQFPQGNGSPLGLWMLVLSREYVESIHDFALSSPHEVEVLPAFGSLFLQNGKLITMRDTGLFKISIFCKSGLMQTDLIEAQVPALWKRVQGK